MNQNEWPNVETKEQGGPKEGKDATEAEKRGRPEWHDGPCGPTATTEDVEETLQ